MRLMAVAVYSLATHHYQVRAPRLASPSENRNPMTKKAGPEGPAYSRRSGARVVVPYSSFRYFIAAFAMVAIPLMKPSSSVSNFG